MKTLAVVLSLWAFSVHAADECKSVWVYKPYKTCSDAKNGLDLSKATPTGETKILPTPALKGGPGAEAACANIGKSLEIKLADSGVIAEKSAISDGKGTKDMVGHVTYVYQCSFRMMKAPFKTTGPACGEEDKYSYQTQGTAEALNGKAHCLSCDSATKTRELANCLIQTAKILPEVSSSIPVRDEDRQAVLKRVELLIKVNNVAPAQPELTLSDLEKISDLKAALQTKSQ